MTPGTRATRADKSRRSRHRAGVSRCRHSFHDVKQRSFFVPAARCCARVCPSLRMCLRLCVRRRRGLAPAAVATAAIPSPRRGVDGAPTGALFLRSRLRRATTCPGATGTSLGAPPWRFSAGARASSSGIGSGAVQRLLAARPSCLAGGVRTSRARGYAPRPQDATPRSVFRIVSRKRPSMSEDANLYTINSLRSQ